eukprot:1832789-Pyramimonas_sp.AAC.1
MSPPSQSWKRLLVRSPFRSVGAVPDLAPGRSLRVGDAPRKGGWSQGSVNLGELPTPGLGPTMGHS